MVAEHITNLPCDKHSGKRTQTQMLVVHSIESPLTNGYAVSMAKNWLGKWYDGNGALIEASSNIIVSPDTLVRSVHTDYAAWHASWANNLSVGYEQAGYAAFTRAQWLTDLGKTQIDRLAREMAQDAKLYGIPLQWLTRAQVNAIAAGDRTIKGLVTHAVIDPASRTDPGSGYPYDVLLASIRKYAGGSTKPQGTKPTPIQEDDMPLTAQDKKDIAIAVWGYKNSALERDDAYALLRAIRDRVLVNPETAKAIKEIQGRVTKYLNSQTAEGLALDREQVGLLNDLLAVVGTETPEADK